MEIKENYSLKSFNTFGINVDAKYFTQVASLEELEVVLDFIEAKKIPFLILGGGSNLLFTKDFDGIMIKADFKGIKIVKEDQQHIFVKAEAGENWDEFVQFCVDNNFAGLENLSLIPGNVGASPIQNIGAYGVELKDHFFELEFFDFAIRSVQKFGMKDCAFGYRNSVFKNELKGKGMILSVTYRLNKHPEFKTEYGTIKDEIEAMGVSELSVKTIRQAVISIRRSKLPDPEIIGNAGSFFKNPTISMEEHRRLKNKFPEIVSFPQSDRRFKLAAGWLIDQCGWKGKRVGDAGVHENQALVLVNYGNASGKEIYDLSEEIKISVFDKFGVELEREVNIL